MSGGPNPYVMAVFAAVLVVGLVAAFGFVPLAVIGERHAPPGPAVYFPSASTASFTGLSGTITAPVTLSACTLCDTNIYVEVVAPGGTVASGIITVPHGELGGSPVFVVSFASPGTYGFTVTAWAHMVYIGAGTTNYTATEKGSITVSEATSVSPYVHPSFTASQVPKSLSMTFVDRSTTSGSVGQVVESKTFWLFGDGGTAYGGTVTHTYVVRGTYSVTETVTAQYGFASNTTTQSITVQNSTAVGEVTTIAPGFSWTSVSTTVVFFDSSTVENGTLLSWSWSFGDASGAASGKVTNHTYGLEGTYVVTETVVASANAGGTVTASVSNNVTAHMNGTTVPPPVSSIQFVPTLVNMVLISAGLGGLIAQAVPATRPLPLTAFVGGVFAVGGGTLGYVLSQRGG